MVVGGGPTGGFGCGGLPWEVDLTGGRGGDCIWWELVLAELAVGVVAGERLEQFPSFPGKQLSQDFFAFTQAQPLQEPDLFSLVPSRK